MCFDFGLLIELFCGNVIAYEVGMGYLRWPSTILNAEAALPEAERFERGGGSNLVRRRRSGIHLTTVSSGGM